MPGPGATRAEQRPRPRASTRAAALQEGLSQVHQTIERLEKTLPPLTVAQQRSSNVQRLSAHSQSLLHGIASVGQTFTSRVQQMLQMQQHHPRHPQQQMQLQLSAQNLMLHPDRDGGAFEPSFILEGALND